MTKITVKKNDIKDNIYFIIAITQSQASPSMQGALSSKGDLIGGIFDRWINTITESIVFNRIIVPELNIDDTDELEIVSDYFIYDPKKSGIAPDVIGIRFNGNIIPFVLYNDKWVPVDGMPQIEIKSFKEKQYMVTLRDQHYSDKYLIMCETDFRIDYLLPFFDINLFNDTHLNQDDLYRTFVIYNRNNDLHMINEVDFSSDTIGTIDLLKITKANSFIESSTHCKEFVSVQYLKNIEKKNIRRKKDDFKDVPLSKYLDSTDVMNIFTFNPDWYEGVNDQNIPYYTKKTKSGNIQFLYKTLDLAIENISSINVVRKNINSLYIETDDVPGAKINDICLETNSTYKIDFDILDRSSNSGEEYFLNKALIHYIPCFKSSLIADLKNILKLGGEKSNEAN